MTTKEKKELFDRIFKGHQNPAEWGFRARELRQAAEILFDAKRESYYPDGEPKKPENERMHTPATMLYGYAIENAIKGCLIKKHGGFDKAKDFLGTAWNRHRLVDLARQTGLPLSNDLVLLLGTLEAFVRWAGKYPISLKREEFTLQKQHVSGEYITPNELNLISIQILDEFLERLLKDVLAEFNAKWHI